MFTASWEIINENREDFGYCETEKFTTLAEAETWLDFRLHHWEYYCIVFNDEGHIVLTSWIK